MPSIYVHRSVDLVRELHAAQYAEGAASCPIGLWIDRQARTLLQAHARGDVACTVQLRSVVPGEAEIPVDRMLAEPMSYQRALRAVALDHGFDRALEALDCTLHPDPDFERALDLMERANVAGLRRLLDERPSLATERSRFRHGATLLHYLTANGVEIRRQVVPSNAPRLAMVLVEAGADPGAQMRAYGGLWSVRDLLETSAHPTEAGVADDFSHVLRVAGA